MAKIKSHVADFWERFLEHVWYENRPRTLELEEVVF